MHQTPIIIFLCSSIFLKRPLAACRVQRVNLRSQNNSANCQTSSVSHNNSISFCAKMYRQDWPEISYGEDPRPPQRCGWVPTLVSALVRPPNQISGSAPGALVPSHTKNPGSTPGLGFDCILPLDVQCLIPTHYMRGRIKTRLFSPGDNFSLHVATQTSQLDV
jgi:hypothetical protein